MSKTMQVKQHKIQSPYPTQPWECRHHQSHSELVAYVKAIDDWETIAVVRSTIEVDAETMAKFIVSSINNSRHQEELLHNAIEALELCLEEAQLTFSSEQAVDTAISRIKQKREIS